MEDRGVYARILEDRFFTGIVILLSFMSLVPLFLILYYIGRKGISAINWGFFTSLPAPVGEVGGGISNALIGTSARARMRSNRAVQRKCRVFMLASVSNFSATAGMSRLSH